MRENSVYAILRDALTSAGYMPLVATVPRTPEGKFVDFALLEAMLRQQVDLTVCLHDVPSVVAWLSKRKIPFVLFGRDAARSRGSVGFVDNRAAIGERLAECVLEYLATGAFPKDVVVGPKYVRGETF